MGIFDQYLAEIVDVAAARLQTKIKTFQSFTHNFYEISKMRLVRQCE